MLTVNMLGEELCGVVELHVPSCDTSSFLTPETPTERNTYNPSALQHVSWRNLIGMNKIVWSNLPYHYSHVNCEYAG